MIMPFGDLCNFGRYGTRMTRIEGINTDFTDERHHFSVVCQAVPIAIGMLKPECRNEPAFDKLRLTVF